MIPYLLAIAGGYLIAQSRKQDTFANGGTMDEGGLMKDFDKNFTTAYILQQQMADKQKVQGVAHDSYDTTYYNEKYYPIRYHDGHSFASKELYNDLRDGSGNLKGSDEREVEEKITAYFDESDVKKLSGSTLHDMWKNGEGILVEKKKKKWFFGDGGEVKITNEYREFDVDVFNEVEDEELFGFLVKDGKKEIGIVRAEEDVLDKGVGYILGLEVFEMNKGYGKKIIKKLFQLHPTQKSFGGKATSTSKGFWLKMGAEFENEYDFILKRENLSYSKGGTIEEALERFDVTKLDAFEKMQYNNF